MPPLEDPIESKDDNVVATGPDDVFRAGADAIEAEDLSSGYSDVVDLGNPDPKAVAPVEDPPAEDPPAENPPAENPPANIMIPKSRLDQEAARRRAAENQLRQIQQEAGSDSPEQTQKKLEAVNLDLGEAPKEMFDKLLDGDIESANKLFGDIINSAAQTAAQTGYEKARGEIDSVVDSNTQATDEGQVVLDLEATYDFFRPGDEAFDSGAIKDVIAMQAGFVSQGYTRADAMRTAAQYVIDARAPAPVAPQPTLGDPTPDPTKAPVKTPEEVKRNVDADAAQPPVVNSGRPNPTTSELPDISTLTLEEVDALPEATIKRLRGDFV